MSLVPDVTDFKQAKMTLKCSKQHIMVKYCKAF